jgi:hypothetical protein
MNPERPICEDKCNQGFICKQVGSVRIEQKIGGRATTESHYTIEECLEKKESANAVSKRSLASENASTY